MEAIQASSIQAASIALLVIVYLVNVFKNFKEKKTQTSLDFAASLIEEAIAETEHKTYTMKREAASEAGKALRKQPVDVTKDPIKVEKYLQQALAPVREIAHNMAKDYIIKSIDNIKSSSVRQSVKKLITNKTIDQAIKMRVAGPKCGVSDPLKAFFYREV